ncbi:MAG: FAD-dependent oxidoreductase [Acidobacteriota bacterium]|nr:FAD-dependent oxidoreductase [Acidobacteriota bacterium]
MQPKMTKRQFLQSIGAVSGVAAMYRSMDALGMASPVAAGTTQFQLTPAPGYGTRVVILGAGVSGLVAAYELSKAGYDCTVLEATGRAGGRNLTARSGDVIEEEDSRQWVDFDAEDHLYVNLGPARIPYHHTTILGYCREFGVDLEVFTNDNRAAFFHNQDRFDGPVVARQVMTDSRGYIAELLAKAVNRNALDSELTGEDKELILEMLRSYGGLDPDDLYVGSSRGGYVGPHVHAGLVPGAVNDPLDLSQLLRSDFWRYKLHFSQFLDQNPTLLQPIGGMDAIVAAFKERVEPLIVYRTIVEEIQNTADGVRIVYRSPSDIESTTDGVRIQYGTWNGSIRSLEADFAICTIPAPVLRGIPNNFSRRAQRAIESIEFTNAVKIGFQAQRRFWEEDHAIYGGISWTDQDITQIWYPAYGYHREKGIVLGAYIWDSEPGMRYSGMTPFERLQSAIAEGEHIHTGYGDEMESGVSRAWSKVPFQRGGWPESYEPPGRLRGPDGRIYFAGDQLSALPGWQEGAALAAQAAVAAIQERVTMT